MSVLCRFSSVVWHCGWWQEERPACETLLQLPPKVFRNMLANVEQLWKRTPQTTRISYRWQTRAARCIVVNMLQANKVDAQCDKLAITLSWQHFALKVANLQLPHLHLTYPTCIWRLHWYAMWIQDLLWTVLSDPTAIGGLVRANGRVSRGNSHELLLILSGKLQVCCFCLFVCMEHMECRRRIAGIFVLYYVLQKFTWC